MDTVILTKAISSFDKAKRTDILLIALMAIGAACGMIYEYIVAHYAGRILGSVDTTIYGVIGLMIVAMGVGAFYSRTVRCPYTGFAWLEAAIAFVGGLSVLGMSALFSVAFILPQQLQHAFGLHETIALYGGPIFVFAKISEAFPYITGIVIGLFLGMEIPFIARIREDVYSAHLTHNAGTVYGADYIGGGVGAAIWITVCLKLHITTAAALTALLNVVLGCIFLVKFRDKIRFPRVLGGINAALICLLSIVLANGISWMNAMSNMMYQDSVVHAQQSKFQNLIITERRISHERSSVISLFINGHLQFSSSDEAIYHGMLVAPAMLASARNDKVLIVGGGDGLALRDVLKWNPQSVTLVDLDPDMVKLFSGKQPDTPSWLNQRILELNASSLLDPRVRIINDDAFKQVEALVAAQDLFDVIIVDLPDPNHPDLNKLYSDYFYARLASLLNGDGALAVQSTSPYHSKKAFQSIGKTIETAGLLVDQYHANVPTFGEWGWTLATKQGLTPRQRVLRAKTEEVHQPAISYDLIVGAFAFSGAFYNDLDEVKINRLNSPTLYSYHSEGWRANKGIFLSH